jgi:hypothetical protein
MEEQVRLMAGFHVTVKLTAGQLGQPFLLQLVRLTVRQAEQSSKYLT